VLPSWSLAQSGELEETARGDVFEGAVGLLVFSGTGVVAEELIHCGSKASNAGVGQHFCHVRRH